ncbi:MAG: nucleoside deaminase, partial [Bacteroidota bacterium]
MINNDTTWQIHQKYMAQALRLAEVAFDEHEVPIGAIIVHENKIVGKGYNQVQKLNDPTAHAEMIAISAATQTIGQKYIKDATMYVTLEPCPMCTAALVWSKIGRVVYAASDASYGACGSIYH